MPLLRPLLRSACLLLVGLGLASPVPRSAAAQPIPTSAAELGLSDAVLQTALRDSAAAAWGDAATAYLTRLQATDALLATPTCAEHARAVAQMLLLWPPAERARLLDRPAEDLGADDPFPNLCAAPSVLRPGAGRLLATWWRGEDPDLGTPFNERLEEHLQRIAHAEAAYPDPERPHGLDDRGVIYVRYGPPDAKGQVRYRDSRLTALVTMPDAPSVRPVDDNEVWAYASLDPAYGRFIFTKQRGRHRLGGHLDLIPNALQGGYGLDKRSALRALLLQAFRLHIADELERIGSGIPGPRLMRSYLFIQDRMARIQRYADPRSRLQNRGQRVLQDLRDDDFRFADIQRERLPVALSRYDAPEQQLPVTLYAARFLDPDGATRTELYWSHPPGTFFDAPGAVTVTLTHLDAAYDVRTVLEETRPAVHARTTLLPNTQTLTLAPSHPVPAAPQDTASVHLRLRWRQDGDRTGRARIDHLAPLATDPAQLELSDLLLTRDDAPPAPGTLPRPYAARTVRSRGTLGLYLEAYHLTFGADDRTRYTVAYEVERPGERRLFRRGAPDRTIAQTTHTGASRTAREFILLDLEAIASDEPVTLTVRVTDEVSGLTEARSVVLAFTE